MRFTLTQPRRLCLFRVLLEACPFCFLQYTVLPACCNCSPLLFRVCVGRCPSPTVRSSGCPTLFAKCLFFFFSCFFIIQFVFFFFSFFPGWESICPGGYADLFQGVPHATFLLTWWSPKQGRSLCLAVREPSWFLHLTWRGDAMHGLRVWRCWSFASSWWFFLPGVSPVSLQEFTLGVPQHYKSYIWQTYSQHYT
jgi:hypothetical protein